MRFCLMLTMALSLVACAQSSEQSGPKTPQEKLRESYRQQQQNQENLQKKYQEQMESRQPDQEDLEERMKSD